jgi:hypothetical protein
LAAVKGWIFDRSQMPNNLAKYVKGRILKTFNFGQMIIEMVVPVHHSDLKCPITFGNAKMTKMHIFEKF